MELKPLGKLHEIIIEYARYIYEEGTYMAYSNGIQYPYTGAIFAFEKDGQSLKLIDNTEYIHPNGTTSLPVHHGDFIEPKSNQVKAAFLKFQYCENKIHWAQKHLYKQDNAVVRTEIRIVTDKLLGFTLEMLKSLAESYSIREVNPEEGQVYWVYPGMQPPLAAYGLHVWAGCLKIGADAPATLQLKVEEFNDILVELSEGKTSKELKYTEILQAEAKPALQSQSIRDNRAEIVRSIMTSGVDFKNRNKVKELARKLDDDGIPLPQRRRPQPTKWEPKTYIEVTEKPTSLEYKRNFNHRIGVLVRDLGKK
ncbi:MAG: hypothetical protein JXR49_19410 [Acidobacteria bacterium]|nr:hypothetical protein [Acidobacteriota bacterium]